MSRFFAIVKKDFFELALAPFYYVLQALVFFLLSLFFYSYLRNSSDLTLLTVPEKVLRPLFGNLSFIFMIVVPLVISRIIVSEKERGTMDLFRKSGMNFYSFVLAKFTASVFLFFPFIVVSILFPLVLYFMGANIYSEMIPFVLGVFLLSFYFISTSLFFSTISKSSF